MFSDYLWKDCAYCKQNTKIGYQRPGERERERKETDFSDRPLGSKPAVAVNEDKTML